MPDHDVNTARRMREIALRKREDITQAAKEWAVGRLPLFLEAIERTAAQGDLQLEYGIPTTGSESRFPTEHWHQIVCALQRYGFGASYSHEDRMLRVSWDKAV